MAKVQRSIRIPEDLDRKIEMEAERRGRSGWSEQVIELLDEALRMRQCPGIIFVDGPAGRRAMLAGTGLDVWEVIAGWKDVDEDWDGLQGAFPKVPDTKLRAALHYYELFPKEIDERLAREQGSTPEWVKQSLPFSHPHELRV